jgi:(p)ppGpp synthase/HD superfamily hydrolase
MSILDEAIKIAVTAHAGQVDTLGEPYILHPLAVMLDPELRTEQERTAAVCHDLLEDTAVTAEDLRAAGIGERVVEAVEALSRAEDEDYGDYVRRAAANEIAVKVKRADLRHNSRPDRVGRLPGDEKKQRMLEKYALAREILGMAPPEEGT